MATLKDPIQDILTKLSTISMRTPEGVVSPIYARIWNNQLRDLREGKLYEFPRPAVFVEISSPINFENVGVGIRSADLYIRFHLIHDFFNLDGSMEQDLIIYDLRDQILLAFSQYCPTGCGTLLCLSETQDYDHDNLYHYVMEWKTNFRDSKSSPYDPQAGKYIDTADPLLDAEIIFGGFGSTPNVTSTDYYIIK